MNTRSEASAESLSRTGISSMSGVAVWDVNVADFPRFAGEVGDSHSTIFIK